MEKELVCKSCGYSINTFYKTGMLGCPDCYTFFSEQISNLIKKVQHGEFHKGKKPHITDEESDLISEYSRLLAEKENAKLNGKFGQMQTVSKDLYEVKLELEKRGLL